MNKKPTGFEGPSVWNGCTLIYSPAQNLATNIIDSKELQSILHQYASEIGHPPKFNVWYDTISKVCFGMDETWMNSNTKKSSFISPPEEFLKSDKRLCNSPTARDLNHVLSYYGPHFGKDVIFNDEIIFLNHPQIQKFKNSKILVIAGGPSAKEMHWDEKKYDYIFSCNHFYLNDRLKNINVDFAVIGGEIDMSLENKKFHNYMKDNDTLLCFEDRTSPSAAKYFGLMKKIYKDRCIYAHSRYRGKPGVGLRLLCYAALLGAKEVHFVGVDGMSENTKRGDFHNHAFQEGKRYSHKALDFGTYRRHYVLFWDYILNYLKLNEKIKFQNLGEGHEKNQTTTISKQFFPLQIG
tara:strand:- start:62008 stop:63060 length:1053 start_codon:yes stop_codon:yes gene_type:complete